MDNLNNALKGLQVLLVVFGLGYMIINLAEASQLSLPADMYSEKEFLSLILNALQVLGLYAGAVALGSLIRTFWR